MSDSRDRLRRYGAEGTALDELVAYCADPYVAAGPMPAFPLADEPHVERWRLYVEEARAEGAFAALRRRFVQLRVPVQAGISADEAYRAATRRGRSDEADRRFAPGLVLEDPRGLQLELCATISGTVPVLTAATRNDFDRLVQAFTERNEPVPVPASMGACLVTGLNNWDRIAAYRERWARGQPDGGSEKAWAEEFARLVLQKALYQDRVVILSGGPYSATAALDAGLPEDEWLARSLVIRREHELTHYFTYRVFGRIRSHVLDELVADFVGLVRAFGRYRADLARRFLGIECFPAYRPGGRLEGYRGTPPLSNEAFAVLTRLAHTGIEVLEQVSVRHADRLADLSRLARATYVLATCPLEALTEPWVLDRVGAALR